MATHAAIYLRAAGSEPVVLERLSDLCRRYADMHGLTVVDEFTDEGRPAGHGLNPGLSACTATPAPANRFMTVVAPEESRAKGRKRR